MLSRRQNMLETVKGGLPDRLVNQFEAMPIMAATPCMAVNRRPQKGGEPVQDLWGVWRAFPEDQPGAYPLHDGEYLLCDDIEEWRDVIKAPEIPDTEEAWAPAVEKMNAIDRNEYFGAVVMAPGIFESLHAFQGMVDAMANFLAEPELTHELIDYLTEYELRVAELNCKYLHPDVVFHHDDWGSKVSTFVSPEMFDEFITPAYKKIYGYYKEHGVQLVVHHSDSFAATLIPSMIEMGIDVWQGVMTTNDIPTLLQQYEGEITFMGGVDSELVDFPEWTPEIVESVVREKCEELKGVGFIPCITQGGAFSTFPGVYDCATEVIKKINSERYGFSIAEQ